MSQHYLLFSFRSSQRVSSDGSFAVRDVRRTQQRCQVVGLLIVRCFHWPSADATLVLDLASEGRCFRERITLPQLPWQGEGSVVHQNLLIFSSFYSLPTSWVLWSICVCAYSIKIWGYTLRLLLFLFKMRLLCRGRLFNSTALLRPQYHGSWHVFT